MKWLKVRQRQRNDIRHVIRYGIGYCIGKYANECNRKTSQFGIMLLPALHSTLSAVGNMQCMFCCYRYRPLMLSPLPPLTMCKINSSWCVRACVVVSIFRFLPFCLLILGIARCSWYSCCRYIILLCINTVHTLDCFCLLLSNEWDKCYPIFFHSYLLFQNGIASYLMWFIWENAIFCIWNP